MREPDRIELYILRHAIAADRDAWAGREDRNRPLTDEGIVKLREVVRGMRALGLSFGRILSSPFLRARQTAEIVAADMRFKGVVESSPHLAPGGEAGAMIDEINVSRAGPVLLVGHEPGLSQLISMLLAGNTVTGITLKKASLCKLVAPTLRYARCASLEWLLAPAQSRRIR